MALTPRLDLRQSQQLVMTPQLQQAIKLLQLSNAELAAYIEGEIERNPLLEAGDPDREGEGADDRADAPDEQVGDGFEAAEQSDAVDFEAASDAGGVAANDDPIDADIDNVHHSDFDATEGVGGGAFDAAAARGGRADFDSDDRSLEETLGDDGDLRSHLIAQAQIDIPDDVERLIFLRLLDALDENGRLTIDLAALADELGCAPERVDDVLNRAQRMDPTGVFARDLKECLALQLRELDRLDPAMATLLEHLDVLADRDVDKLRKLCGVDDEDLMEMVAEIRALDPLPGQQWAGEAATVVAPDILMRAKPGGGWHIELNADTLPRVLVNTHYYTSVVKSVRDKTEREFVGECWQAANWLVKSLHQRANTILKVAGEIVRQQENFFIFGVEHLKPLVLRDVAEKIAMHESTVSRVTANKYMATPRGMYELKYFFTASIQGADGRDAHSAEAVRHRIRALIDAEQPKAVMSDDAIVDALRGQGVDIARRTVAKYREAMRIPSSVQRRRMKTSGI